MPTKPDDLEKQAIALMRRALDLQRQMVERGTPEIGVEVFLFWQEFSVKVIIQKRLHPETR